MDYFQDAEQSHRFRNRSILLFIILTTLPFYIVGAIMLGVAPRDAIVLKTPTLPPPNQRTSLAETATTTATPTINLTQTDTPPALLNTPFQFRTPTRFPTQVPASSTPAPSLTSLPSPTSTLTLTPTATPTTPENRPPVFDVQPSNITLNVGQTQTVSLSFSDPDGDVVSLTASSDNAAVAFISGFGQTSFDVFGQSAGTATITITLQDPQGATATATIVATVTIPNNPPIFTVEPQHIALNQGQSHIVLLLFSDPDGDAVTFTAIPVHPAIASVTLLDATSFQVNALTAGQTTITIQLSDGKGGTAQRIITVTIAAQEVNQPPHFDTEPLPITITTGDSMVVFLQVSDPDGDPISLQVVPATQGLVTFTVLNGSSFTVQGLTVGVTTVTLVLHDGKNGTTQRTIQATITQP